MEEMDYNKDGSISLEEFMGQYTSTDVRNTFSSVCSL